MHITVLQENLLQALQDVAKSVSSKPSLPILSCILLTADDKTIQVAATDLNLGTRSQVQGTVQQAGKVAIPARTLLDFVATLEAGPIELVFEGNTLKIQAGKSKANIQCFAADDYPVFPTKEGTTLTLPVETFLPIFQQTVIAASLDETRPILTSLQLQFGEQLEVAATDGFRLAISTLAQKAEELKLLVPAKAVQEVIRIASKKKAQQIDFTISQRLKQLFFGVEGVEILVRLLEGDFPLYKKITPTSFATEIVFDGAEFTQKLKTAMIFAREASSIIRIQIGAEDLKIVAASSALGTQESTLPIKVLKGGAQEIAFNGKYVQDFLNTLKPQEIWFGMNESLKPAVFKVVGHDDFQYVVMPFRVNS